MTRRALLIGVGDYRDADITSLTSPVADITALAPVLADPAIGDFAVELLPDPEAADFRSAVSRFLATAQAGDTTLLCLSCHGHLDPLTEELTFLTVDSEAADPLARSVEAAFVSKRLQRAGGASVLVLDCCHAGAIGHGVKATGSLIDPLAVQASGYALLTACSPNQLALEGEPGTDGTRGVSVFTQAFIDGLTGALGGDEHEWRTVGDLYERYLHDEVRRRTANRQVPRHIANTAGAILLARRPAPEQPTPAPALAVLGTHPYFTGRADALHDLAGWLRRPVGTDNVRVVTGRSGSGKSAVLAQVVGLVDTIDVVVNASGQTTAAIAGHLRTVLGLDCGTDVASVVRAVVDRDRPTTVVFDAVEEAAVAEDLTGNLILPLMNDGVRVLVGARHPGGLHTPSRAVVDLDHGYARPRDIVDCVRAVLLAEWEPDVATPYQGHEDVAGRHAELIADRAGTNFLIARRNAEELRESPTMPTTEDVLELPVTVERVWQGWLFRVAKSLRGIGFVSLDDPRDPTGKRWLEGLLAPLAVTEGPVDPDIWLAVTRRITHRYDAIAGPATLIGTRLDDLVTWSPDGAGVALAHTSLADTLRKAHDGETSTPATIQAAFADELIDRVPRSRDGRREWAATSAYTLRHLATHARAGGRLPILLGDAEYLVHADSSTLLAALKVAANAGDTGPVDSRDAVAAYRAAVSRRRDDVPGSWRQLLALECARHDVPELAAALCADAGSNWRPVWASGTHSRRGHSDEIWSVTCAEVASEPVAVTCGDDASIRVWDVQTGTLRAVLDGHDATVFAVTCVPDRGRTYAVSVSQDYTARVWDLDAGELVHEFAEHFDWVGPAGWLRLDGRPLVVTPSGDQSTLVWDLHTGEVVYQLSGHTGPVHDVAVADESGHPVVITTGFDDQAMVWNLAAPQPRSTAAHGSRTSPADRTVPGGPAAVAAGGEVLSPLHVLFGHTDVVRRAAHGELPDGRSVAVTTSDDHTAMVWDLATGDLLHELVGHRDMVNRVLCTRLPDGVPVVVTTSEDHHARVWDLRDGRLLRVFDGHRGVVFRPRSPWPDVVVTAAGDSTVRAWRLSTGAPLWTVIMPVPEIPLTEGRDPHTSTSCQFDFASNGDLVVTAGTEVAVFRPTGSSPTTGSRS